MIQQLLQQLKKRAVPRRENDPRFLIIHVALFPETRDQYVRMVSIIQSK